MKVKPLQIIQLFPSMIKQPRRVVISLLMFIFSKDQDAFRIATWTNGNLKRVSTTEIFHGIESVDVTIHRTLDFVFIDGCHSYSYVKSDTQNALKYLKQGGILVWHDYGMKKDVSSVIDETARKIKVNAIQGTRLAIGFV